MFSPISPYSLIQNSQVSLLWGFGSLQRRKGGAVLIEREKLFVSQSVTGWFSFPRITLEEQHTIDSVASPDPHASEALNMGTVCQQHKPKMLLPVLAQSPRQLQHRIVTLQDPSWQTSAQYRASLTPKK